MDGVGSSVGDRVVNAALQLAIAALDGQVNSFSYTTFSCTSMIGDIFHLRILACLGY